MEEFWVVGPAWADIKNNLLSLAQQNSVVLNILEEDDHLSRKKLRFTVHGTLASIGSFHKHLAQEPYIKFIGLGG
jgi:hypothetical protein